MISSITHFMKSRQLLPVIAILFASIVLVFMPQTVKISISGVFTRFIYSPFNQLDDFLLGITRAKGENVTLKEKLVGVSMKASQFTEDHYENNRLRRMLGFDLQLPHSLVPAEVIGLRPGLMSKSVVINIGSKNGIQRNMPVVTADGIVGKTIEVSPTTAIVQLLIDHNCKVSAIDQNTRAMGIIRWRGGKYLEMGDVPIESHIAVGDSVISSGLGGIFPPSLMVGTVIFSHDEAGTLFKDVFIKPSVDFSTLEEVFVVIYGE